MNKITYPRKANNKIIDRKKELHTPIYHQEIRLHLCDDDCWMGLRKEWKSENWHAIHVVSYHRGCLDRRTTTKTHTYTHIHTAIIHRWWRRNVHRRSLCVTLTQNSLTSITTKSTSIVFFRLTCHTHTRHGVHWNSLWGINYSLKDLSCV
jgi:hypothetical protein